MSFWQRLLNYLRSVPGPSDQTQAGSAAKPPVGAPSSRSDTDAETIPPADSRAMSLGTPVLAFGSLSMDPPNPNEAEPSSSLDPFRYASEVAEAAVTKGTINIYNSVSARQSEVAAAATTKGTRTDGLIPLSASGAEGDAKADSHRRTVAHRDGSLRHHPVVDLAKWAAIYPLAPADPDDREGMEALPTPSGPDDIWNFEMPLMPGLFGPSDLCGFELIRQKARLMYDLGRAVPVDIFLWRAGSPETPYLTKMGGVPHRDRTRPWPVSPDGTPLTFVAQICFLDSLDIVSDNLPGDVMLIFMRRLENWSSRGKNVAIEWVSPHVETPMTPDDCPAPEFFVPELSGEIYRLLEYPESWGRFERGFNDVWCPFMPTQSTRIGREAYFIQSDPRREDLELFCVLSSVAPELTNAQEWIESAAFRNNQDANRGRFDLMLSDVGCLYFLIDPRGQVFCRFDCY